MRILSSAALLMSAGVRNIGRDGRDTRLHGKFEYNDEIELQLMRRLHKSGILGEERMPIDDSTTFDTYENVIKPAFVTSSHDIQPDKMHCWNYTETDRSYRCTGIKGTLPHMQHQWVYQTAATWKCEKCGLTRTTLHSGFFPKMNDNVMKWLLESDFLTGCPEV